MVFRHVTNVVAGIGFSIASGEGQRFGIDRDPRGQIVDRLFDDDLVTHLFDDVAMPFHFVGGSSPRFVQRVGVLMAIRIRSFTSGSFFGDRNGLVRMPQPPHDEDVTQQSHGYQNHGPDCSETEHSPEKQLQRPNRLGNNR
ncbi:MAG: hypothetical protein ACK55Z_15040, partial [bacterium]